jgi:hypothetical protein
MTVTIGRRELLVALRGVAARVSAELSGTNHPLRSLSRNGEPTKPQARDLLDQVNPPGEHNDSLDDI